MPQTGTFSCPSCGAPLKVEAEGATMQCPFCNASVVIPEDLRLKPAPPPPPSPPREPEVVYVPTPIPVPRPRGRLRRSSGSGGCLIWLILLAGAFFYLRTQPWAQPFVAQLSQLANSNATVEPITRPLTTSLPRAVTYGGLEFTLTQAVIDNQDKSGDETVYRTDQAFARLKLTARNTTRKTTYADFTLFKLRLADGKDYPNQNYSITMPDPAAASEIPLVFEVPTDAQWDGAKLVLSSGEAEPAEIPLTGKMPKAAFPAQLKLPAQTEIAAPEQGLTYKLLSAALDLDNETKRVEAGKRYLKLDMRLINTGNKYGIAIGPGLFRLTVDGVPFAPEDAPIEAVALNASLEGEVVFVVPAAATSAELQLGEVTNEATQFVKLTLDLRGSK